MQRLTIAGLASVFLLALALSVPVSADAQARLPYGSPCTVPGVGQCATGLICGQSGAIPGYYECLACPVVVDVGEECPYTPPVSSPSPGPSGSGDGGESGTTGFFGPIIPDACHCPGSAPSWGCVLQVSQNVVNFAISFTILVIVLVIAWAGGLWLLSPFNPRMREQGRSMLLGAVVGLLIALSSWLIVDFVMKMLYNDASFGPWNSILSGNEDNMCIRQLDLNTGAMVPAGDGSVTGTSGSAPGSGRSSLSDAIVRTRFVENAGYSIWSSGSCSADRTGCTYLGGLQQATVDTIVSLGNACGGGMTITGGSEPGHASGTYSHRNGYKVDIDDTPTANDCITAHASRYTAGDRGGDTGGTAYRDSCGNIYVRESDHWDALILSSCTY